VSVRDGDARLIEGDLFGERTLGARLDLRSARLLAPLDPPKLIAIGLNYKDHAAEQNKPLPAAPMVFLKPPSAVIGPQAPIRRPAGVGRVDHEAEMGVVIGRGGADIPEAEAAGHVFGITCVNDVTARDLQARGIQFAHCKGYDTFAPMGPCIAVGLDPSALDVECWVNAERRQSSNTRELIFSVPRLIAYISRIMTLTPGDVIATGTPSGIGPIAPGDTVTVRVGGVGDLVNPVHARDENGDARTEGQG
jgi:2-keto-4-pentenoate hydratase/2-oxohepta-3-ene-1,7-dioic acid hydratase in catechol pathway